MDRKRRLPWVTPARAKYDLVKETDQAVTIRDTGAYGASRTAVPSVTNDAEAVVEELAPRLRGRRLFYYDSMGELDELLVEDGHFAGFAPGPGRRR